MSWFSKKQIPKIGVEPFKRIVDGARNDGTHFEISLCDLLDGSITQPDSKGGKVRIHLVKNTSGEVIGLTIKDTNKYGYENIMNNEGARSQLNWGHTDYEKHNDDEQLSKHGKGGKAAWVKFAEQITIVSRCYNDETSQYENWRIIYNIPIMTSGNTPPGEDRNPEWEKISDELFSNLHGYETGTTIKLEHLRYDQIPMRWHDCMKRIEMCIAETYANYISTGYSDIRVGIYGSTEDQMTKIEPFISPFDTIDYPHPITGYDVFMLKDSKGIKEDVIYSNRFDIKNGKKEYESKYNKFTLSSSGKRSKLITKKISAKEFNSDLSDIDEKNIVKAELEGVNTFGYPEFYELSQCHSITLRRRLNPTCCRILSSANTKDVNDNVQSKNDWNFIDKNNNGERNYQALRLTYKDQNLDSKFGQTTSKNVVAPCNNGTLFGETFKYLEKYIRSADKKKSGLNSATNWKENWRNTFDGAHEFDTKQSYHTNYAMALRNKAKEKLEKQKLIEKEDAKRKSKEDIDKFLETGVRESFGETSPSDEDKKIETVIETLQQSSEQLASNYNVAPCETIVNDTSSSEESDTASVHSNTSNTSEYFRRTENKFAPFNKLDTEPKHELYFDLYGRKNGGEETFNDVKGNPTTIKNSIKYQTDEDGYILAKIGLTNQCDRAKGGDYGERMTNYARGFVSSTKIQTMKEGLLKLMINKSMYNVIPLKKDSPRNEWFKIKEEDLNKFAIQFYTVLLD